MAAIMISVQIWISRTLSDMSKSAKPKLQHANNHDIETTCHISSQPAILLLESGFVFVLSDACFTSVWSEVLGLDLLVGERLGNDTFSLPSLHGPQCCTIQGCNFIDDTSNLRVGSLCNNWNKQKIWGTLNIFWCMWSIPSLSHCNSLLLRLFSCIVLVVLFSNKWGKTTSSISKIKVINCMKWVQYEIMLMIPLGIRSSGKTHASAVDSMTDSSTKNSMYHSIRKYGGA